mmetsp:Transcript_17487/g.52582  ORF Transcript_17487/g.52582 Transcript_17487/m.52582 type:complete len:261 (-) Transcript_17487:317-1099(-)
MSKQPKHQMAKLMNVFEVEYGCELPRETFTKRAVAPHAERTPIIVWTLRNFWLGLRMHLRSAILKWLIHSLCISTCCQKAVSAETNIIGPTDPHTNGMTIISRMCQLNTPPKHPPNIAKRSLEASTNSCVCETAMRLLRLSRCARSLGKITGATLATAHESRTDLRKIAATPRYTISSEPISTASTVMRSMATWPRSMWTRARTKYSGSCGSRGRRKKRLTTPILRRPASASLRTTDTTQSRTSPSATSGPKSTHAGLGK